MGAGPLLRRRRGCCRFLTIGPKGLSDVRRFLLLLLALVCLLSVASAVPSTAQPSASAELAPRAAGALKAAGPYDCWLSSKPTCRLSNAVTFNSATGSKSDKQRIVNKIIGAIRRTPRGEQIRIMSWNIMSSTAVKVLLEAQRRGVQIFVLMDATNQSSEVPNPGFRNLQVGLSRYNKVLPSSMRSYAKKCMGSCRRGNSGSAHAKYFIFSAVGASKNVVIQGSANLTTASANNQWNDIYTYVDKPGLYNFTRAIFQQMWLDRAFYPTWKGYAAPTYELYFAPRIANPNDANPTTPRDPLLETLKRVQCKYATGSGTARTVIRAAPDVIRGVWADDVAVWLKHLWDQGCDIKIGYTILGTSTGAILKRKSGRGPVPLRQLAADVDGDKVLDLYFHLKAWTINGSINNTRAYWTMNGSSNISDLSRISDENIGIFKFASVTLAYQRHIEYWFNNPPRSRPVIPSRVPANLDPYANMEKDY